MNDYKNSLENTKYHNATTSKILAITTCFVASCEKNEAKNESLEKVKKIELKVQTIEENELYFLKPNSPWKKSKSYDATGIYFKLFDSLGLKKDLSNLVAVWSNQLDPNKYASLKVFQPSPKIDKNVYITKDQSKAYVIFKKNFIKYLIYYKTGKLTCEHYYLPNFDDEEKKSASHSNSK